MDRQLEAAFRSGNQKRVQAELRRIHGVSGYIPTGHHPVGFQRISYETLLSNGRRNIENAVDDVLLHITLDDLYDEVRRRQKLRDEGYYDS